MFNLKKSGKNKKSTPKDQSYPPVAFYFKVIIGGDQKSDNSFQEVSGLNMELETEDVAEGGENRFVHHLPKTTKHPNLVIKRGIAPKSSKLIKWCKETLESDFSTRFKLKPVDVHLLNEQGQVLYSWSITNALPVSWEIEAFNATKNDVAIEKIEFKYSTLKRAT